QQRAQLTLEVESGVVGADGDAHACECSAARAPDGARAGSVQALSKPALRRSSAARHRSFMAATAFPSGSRSWVTVTVVRSSPFWTRSTHTFDGGSVQS